MAMIIEYDRSPGISTEQKLNSLATSVQRALEDLEGDISGSVSLIEKLSEQPVEFTEPSEVSDLVSGDSLGELVGQVSKNLKDHQHPVFGYDVTFEKDVYITVDSEFESLWTSVFGSGGG